MSDYNRAFQLGIGLNLAFVVTQLIFGFLSNSLALLADAGHNLGDVFGLLIAWGASWLASRRPNKRYTYGWRRASILSPFVNASLLLGVTGFIMLEAVQRLFHPQPVESITTILVALVGIVINGLTALMFRQNQTEPGHDHGHQHSGGQQDDINIRGAFLHMVSDALVSAGVVLSGVVLLMTGWQWVDPLTSLIVGALVGLSAWHLLRESLNLVFDGVPVGINIREIQAYLLDLPGVGSIHDLHIWALSSTEPALTVHLTMLAGLPQADFLARVSQDLHRNFGIEHSTIQIETGAAFLPCSQANCGMGE